MGLLNSTLFSSFDVHNLLCTSGCKSTKTMTVQWITSEPQSIRRFTNECSPGSMDYTYSESDWLVHQCPEYSPTSVNCYPIEPSGYESDAVTERGRRHTSDGLTLQDTSRILEQPDDTFMTFSPNFLNDVAFNNTQQYQVALRPDADLQPLAPRPTSTQSTTPTSCSSLKPIAPDTTLQESFSSRSSVEEEVSSPKKIRRKAQNRDA